MSSNRLIYDVEAFAETMEAQEELLKRALFKGNYINKSRCGQDLNFADKADIESELKGLNRTASKCSAKQWNPHLWDGENELVGDRKYAPPDACNITFAHQASCNPPTNSGR
jgi:hypothetical protein